MSDSCVFLELVFLATNDSSFGNQMYLRIILLLSFRVRICPCVFLSFCAAAVEIFACRWNKTGGICVF